MILIEFFINPTKKTISTRSNYYLIKPTNIQKMYKNVAPVKGCSLNKSHCRKEGFRDKST